MIHRILEGLFILVCTFLTGYWQGQTKAWREITPFVEQVRRDTDEFKLFEERLRAACPQVGFGKENLR